MVKEAGRARAYSALTAGVIICALAGVAFFLPGIQQSPRGEFLGILLILAGLAEALTGWLRRDLRTGRTGLMAGGVALLIGSLFLLSPSLHIVPSSYLILVWLLVRGALLLISSLPWNDPEHAWLAVSGFADVGLFLILLIGLPVTALTISVFGPTPEIIANFAIVLAASFFVAGLSLIVISLLERKPASTDQPVI